MFEAFDRMKHSNLGGTEDQLRDLIFQAQETKFRWGEELRDRIGTVEELQSHSAQMRAQWLENIGGLPECDMPLDARVVRRQELREFTLESILVRSCTGSFISASMYLPRGITYPAPAILFVCGHTPAGRMGEIYQTVCQILARAGLVVFAMDPPGQGERAHFYDPETGEYVIKRSVRDHDACGIPSIATGKFLLRYFLGDEMRAVDYMLTRPEIDPKRIGITGCSGGGTQTAAMMACDPRLAAAAPCAFITTRREIMHSGKPQDAVQIWPGITEMGFDHVTPFMIFAPKPATILALKYDFFPIEGTRETFAQAKRFYGLYGKEENLRMYEEEYIHSYTPSQAVQAAEFFTEVFYGEKRTVSKDNLQMLPEEEMYASPTGQIHADFPDVKGLPDAVRETAAECRARRMKLPEKERLERAENWLRTAVEKNRTSWPFNAKFVTMVPEREGNWESQVIIWWTQQRLNCCGNWIRSNGAKKPGTAPLVLALWDEGTSRISAHADWIRQQCDAGYEVLVMDVPGTGQLHQNILNDEEYRTADWKQYLDTRYRLADDLLYMGDSMPAMHCYDVLQTIRMLKAEYGLQNENITLYCEGNAGVYGVMAGFLNREVGMRYSENLLRSVEKQIIGPKVFYYDDSLSVLLPGMLEYFDYEELMRSE